MLVSEMDFQSFCLQVPQIFSLEKLVSNKDSTLQRGEEKGMTF